MKIERELTSREIDFLGKFQKLFIEFNAIVGHDKERGIYIVVDVKEENDLSKTDISFTDFLDETDIDELFEESCKLHNKKVNSTINP